LHPRGTISSIIPDTRIAGRNWGTIWISTLFCSLLLASRLTLKQADYNEPCMLLRCNIITKAAKSLSTKN